MKNINPLYSLFFGWKMEIKNEPRIEPKYQNNKFTKQEQIARELYARKQGITYLDLRNTQTKQLDYQKALVEKAHKEAEEKKNNAVLYLLDEHGRTITFKEGSAPEFNGDPDSVFYLDIPGNTTISSGYLLFKKSQRVEDINLLAAQRFNSAGTMTITINRKP